jgi:hypothetical protein
MEWVASLEPVSDISEVARLAQVAAVFNRNNRSSSLDVLFRNRKPFPWQLPTHPLVQRTREVPHDDQTIHECIFHSELMTVFKDHTLLGRVLFPATGYVEMALAAASRSLSRLAVGLANVTFVEPCDISVGTMLICDVHGSGSMEFRAAGHDRAKVYCRLEFLPVLDQDITRDPALQLLKDTCTQEIVGIQARYKQLQEQGYHGPQFQTLVQVWQNSEPAAGDEKLFLARLQVPEDSARYYAIHYTPGTAGRHVAAVRVCGHGFNEYGRGMVMDTRNHWPSGDVG